LPDHARSCPTLPDPPRLYPTQSDPARPERRGRRRGLGKRGEEDGDERPKGASEASAKKWYRVKPAPTPAASKPDNGHPRIVSRLGELKWGGVLENRLPKQTSREQTSRLASMGRAQRDRPAVTLVGFPGPATTGGAACFPDFGLSRIPLPPLWWGSPAPVAIGVVGYFPDWVSQIPLPSLWWSFSEPR
jgi:hypothetical protein